MDPADRACAAAGPAFKEEARFFEVPPPPKVTRETRFPSRTLSPPPMPSPMMPAAAAAGPVYDPTKRFPKDDDDRKRRSDAAKPQTSHIVEKRETGKTESVPKRSKIEEPPNTEFEL